VECNIHLALRPGTEGLREGSYAQLIADQIRLPMPLHLPPPDPMGTRRDSERDRFVAGARGCVKNRLSLVLWGTIAE
jgi:hypothetical protein